mgnify:CR=1 FL=1
MHAHPLAYYPLGVREQMFGMMGFVAAAKVPGSVPALDGVVKSYSGDVMGPFVASDSGLPVVQLMLDGWHAF